MRNFVESKVNSSNIEQYKSALNLIDDYIDYTADFKENHKDEYELLEKDFANNYTTFEKTVNGFDLVNFENYKGEPNLYIVLDGQNYYFGINELDGNSFSSNRKVVALYEEHVQEHKTELKNIDKKASELKNQIDNLKPQKPKKILGIFVDLTDKANCERRYNKTLKRLNSEYKDVLEDREMLLYQIECTKHNINSIKFVDEFIKKLTPVQKQMIKQKYEEVKKIFGAEQNCIERLEELNSQIIPLSTYVSNKTQSDSKLELFPLINYLYTTYRQLPEEKKMEISMENLGQVCDFGKYKTQLQVLGHAMDEKEFGRINRQSMKDCQKMLDEREEENSFSK